jgi:hypothetical protein
MLKVLSTLFDSNETYLSKHVAGINRAQAFPTRNLVNSDEFIRNTINDSIIVSGGSDEERSVLLLGLTRSSQACVVIIHNGNRYITADRLRRYGINASLWSENIYSGFSKTQLLSILTADNSDNDLAFFYSYAFDVCEVLNKPTTVQGMYSIDWLGIGWQQELLTSPFNRDRALDLLNRYDRNMAEKAVKGVCRLERLSRGNMIGESSVADGFNDGKVIIKEVYGSNSAMSKQCLEIIQCEAEKGQNFTLLLEDVYIDVPIIRDNFRNVRLILSGTDVSQYQDDMKITNRASSIVAFNHSNYGSCKTISENWFGEYDRLYSESSSGYSKSFLEPRTYNKSVTVRQNRDTRLKPEMLATIPFGCAFIRTRNGLEGYISIA